MVIGIDPGMAATGYGIVCEKGDGLSCVAYGVIKTPSIETHPRRLQAIHRELKEIMAEYGPSSGAVETLFLHKNAATVMAVGQGRGVAMLALADCGLEVGEYTPREVKQAVAGYGAASKRQVQQMVRTLLFLEDVPHPWDAADALARSNVRVAGRLRRSHRRRAQAGSHLAARRGRSRRDGD